VAETEWTASRYDETTTSLLLGVAAEVFRAFGNSIPPEHLAIVGGIVPTLVVPVPPAGVDPHVGTSDIDLCLSLNLIDGDTEHYYVNLFQALTEKLRFTPVTESGVEKRWCWRGSVSDISVQVDLLSPTRPDRTGAREQQPAARVNAELNLGPITACAIDYGHLVPLDTERLTKRVRAIDGEMDFTFPVAGVTSWLCLKSAAITNRRAPKDAYDIVWLLNALNPGDVAGRIADSEVARQRPDEVRSQIDKLYNDLFLTTDAVGAGMYARFMEPSDTDDEPLLRRNAVGAVQQLAQELRERGWFDAGASDAPADQPVA